VPKSTPPLLVAARTALPAASAATVAWLPVDRIPSPKHRLQRWLPSASNLTRKVCSNPVTQRGPPPKSMLSVAVPARKTLPPASRATLPTWSNASSVLH
jgi:hypothetical protein